MASVADALPELEVSAVEVVQHSKYTVALVESAGRRKCTEMLPW